ncbi:MAG: Rpn family recombination-promoting nuclease/putative transposase [Candidatus Cryptobacteroides sp.]|nr:Rpn family recombination-promoting nuclease/putative transposase [Candidatus Cryptobacteroides sp.]
MSEIIKAKYINLMVDWSFKRVFGTEVNKDILIEFLKVVFPQFAITDITYIPTEQLGIMEDDRKAIFDVLCKTEDDKTFLVEMQRGAQKHFFERALYYTSFPIMKQGKKAIAKEEEGAGPWDFSLDGVFFLGILDFEYEQDEMTEHRYQLLETKTFKQMTDKLEFVFVEVAKFNKSEDELETDLDKWLYLLKNMSTLLERPAALRDRVFGRLFDVAEYARLDDEERKNYVEAMNTARDTYNQIAYAHETGHKEGREEGREEKAYEIARKMIAKGLDVDTIAELTGLTKDEILTLEKTS